MLERVPFPPLAVALALALTALVPPPVRAVNEIPDEPDAFVLPDAPTLQVLAADIDGDGSREVVRLFRGEGDAAFVEVWGLGPDGWSRAAEPLQVLAPARIGPRVDLVYAGVPLRAVVHRVGATEQVILATQPRFEEIDAGPPCCLLLHRLVLEGGALRRVQVAQPTDPIGSLLAIDLDGDATDEILTSTSLQPLGDISYPVEARVYRWTGGTFGPPTVTELPVGSGDSPFPIGDSDGRPGDEAAYISTIGPPGLYRVRLAEGDILEMEAFGDVVLDAIGVPIGDGRGLAVTYPDRVEVHRWPARSEAYFREGVARIEDPLLVGVLEAPGEPVLAVHEHASRTLHLLSLPTLARDAGGRIPPSAAAEPLAGLPLDPYVGIVRHGAPGASDELLHAGTLFSPAGATPELPLMDAAAAATLPGAEPIGPVADGGWVALLHSPHRTPRSSPTGGRFDSPTPRPNAWVSIAPRADLMRGEADGGVLSPAVDGALRIGQPGELVAGVEGFEVEVLAPPGSRVLRTEVEPPVVRAPIVVPPSGRLLVPMTPSEDALSASRHEAAVIVVTPAGHGYVARWSVEVLTEPPPLEVELDTPFGSSEVIVSGTTLSHATVTVDGVAVPVDESGAFQAPVAAPPWPTAISVVATDFVGNTTRRLVSGVGLFDYRGLPWIPLVAILVAAAGLALYLRAPRPAEMGAPGADHPVLEELDPD